MNIDWSKAPDWADAHGLHETGFGIKEFWLGETQHQNLERAKSFPYGGGDPSCDSFHNSRRASFSYVTPRPAPWTGEGLPPVGTVCEINHPTMDWVRCEIVAHKVMDCGGQTHAIAWIDGDTMDQSQGLRFRPIRTPEQIAAEERKLQREQLAYLIAGYMGFDDPREADTKLAAYIFDHEYRKQVAP